MSTVLLGGRRIVGFGYLAHHHPWLLLITLALVVALVVWLRRR